MFVNILVLRMPLLGLRTERTEDWRGGVQVYNIQIDAVYALLSVEVDILFSPQSIGTEHENRDPQRP